MNQKQFDLSSKKKKKGERKNKTGLKQGLEKKPKKLVSAQDFNRDWGDGENIQL